MSSFEVCYNWMLDSEDRNREYATVPDSPPGAHAISGINSASFPEEFATIDALPQGQRGPAVEAFYKEKFWNNWFEQIQSDEVTKRVLDCSVNMGPRPAVRLLQEAAGCPVDGVWGPRTISAVNAEGDALVEVFKQLRSSHYRAIVASNPGDDKYLSAWLARASA